MTLKYKLLVDSLDLQQVSWGTFKSACFDLALPHDISIPGKAIAYEGLGIAFKLPKGYCLQMYPRSSTLCRYGLIIPTSIIDEDYRDEVHLTAYNIGLPTVKINKGIRLVQCLLTKTYKTMLRKGVVPTLGRGGLGSTGI